MEEAGPRRVKGPESKGARLARQERPRITVLRFLFYRGNMHDRNELSGRIEKSSIADCE